jgi:hypothetical protein
MRIKFSKINNSDHGLPSVRTYIWVKSEEIDDIEQMNDTLLTIWKNDGSSFDTDSYTGEELSIKLDNLDKLGNCD